MMGGVWGGPRCPPETKVVAPPLQHLGSPQTFRMRDPSRARIEILLASAITQLRMAASDAEKLGDQALADGLWDAIYGLQPVSDALAGPRASKRAADASRALSARLSVTRRL